MVDSVVKVLTFFMIVILILLLLNTVGDYVAAQIPEAAGAIRHILQEIWDALQRIVQPGYQH
jgi:hypothetical protein